MESMKRTSIPCALVIVVASLGLVASCTNQKKEAAAMVEHANSTSPRAVPAVVATEEIASTATITGIDAASRTITLVNQAGESHKFKCGPDVRNFDQLKIGDIVNATIVEQVAIYIRKQGAPPNVAVGGMIARAAPGSNPGIIVSET